MKNLLFILTLGLLIYSCSTTRDPATTPEDPYAQDSIPGDTASADQEPVNDTVRIANDSLEYEIIIIDPGYASFLHSTARPEGYYSQDYLENKNRFLVNDYNQRVRQPFRYNSNIYEQEINYDPEIDYGYEVNYKLYYYFVYLSHRYNQKFSVPTRI